MANTSRNARRGTNRTRGPDGDGNPYRFSFSFIEGWEKRLTRIIWIGVAAGSVLVLAALGLGAAFDGSVPDDDPQWRWVWGLLIAGVVVGGLAILVPLFLGCVLGGLSIHRYGWIPGLLTFVGMVGTAFGLGLIRGSGDWLGGWLTEVCIGVLVAGVLGFFVVGRLARVPMGIGAPPVRRGDGDAAG